MELGEFAGTLQKFFVYVFALLAITNPFGILPVFISMSDDLTEPVREKLFRTVVLTGGIIVLIFALVGTVIMEKFFQVQLSELRIAGGLLLLALGTKNLLFPQENTRHETPVQSGSEEDEIKKRIIPMAFPLLVGPGALSTIIIIQSESGYISTILAVLAAFALIFLLFSRTKYIERVFGKLTLYVLSRVMMVFIMAIGAQMLTAGLKATFPVLGGI